MRSDSSYFIDFPSKWNPLLQVGSKRLGCGVAQIAASAITVLVSYKDCNYGHFMTIFDSSQGKFITCNVARSGTFG